ncbi:MAG: ThuA domain-containing protein [Acidobacteria bacterium]|nr:MAG: ThuA domain-containing protein [Acidobacteriota bacterium]
MTFNLLHAFVNAGSMLLCFLILGPSLAQSPAKPVRVLILTGNSDLPYHDWRLTTPFLEKVLSESGKFEVKVLEDVRQFDSQKLGSFDALVLNYNGPRWGPEVERKIEESVRSGKGLIAIHGVSYGSFFGMEQKDGRWVATNDPGWKAYSEMLGATWKPENVGHARRHVFTVKWTELQHPIACGLEPSFLADDELYHKMDLKPTAHALATAYSAPSVGGTGREEPQIWTVAFGGGRVVHITLGHDVAAMQRSGFLAAFLRGTEWAATGEVTLQTGVKKTQH